MFFESGPAHTKGFVYVKINSGIRNGFCVGPAPHKFSAASGLA